MIAAGDTNRSATTDRAEAMKDWSVAGPAQAGHMVTGDK
jgi:hypothetical protein